MATNRWIPTPQMLDNAIVGEVYFIEISPCFGHARIYVGWAHTGSTLERFAKHCSGQGAKILRKAVEAGCTLKIIHVEPGTRYDERRIKGGHKLEYVNRQIRKLQDLFTQSYASVNEVF